MKFEISPSILSADLSNVSRVFDELSKNKIKYIHLDVMDGVFVPNITFGIPFIKSLLKIKKDFLFDTHLMIVDPEKYIEMFSEVGSDIITFHIEATKNPVRCIELIHDCGKLAGISLNPGTTIDAILPYLDKVDLILVMGVNPGFSGQNYTIGTDKKIKKICDILKEKNINDKIIEVDGGVDDTNIKILTDVGANLIVSGSYLFTGDIGEKINKLYE